jgi:nucleotide-binding universal stress UspA family protein
MPLFYRILNDNRQAIIVWRCDLFKNILLAVDGSDHAIKAAQIAGDLARSMNADLVIVTAFDPIPGYLGEPDRQRVTSAHMSEGEHAMEKSQQEVGQISGKVEKELLEGPAAEAILHVAEARGNDLIVMGTRGSGGLKSLLMGSQSQKVVSHATCPVLLVR